MATPFENYLGSMGFNLSDLTPSQYGHFSNEYNTMGPIQSIGSRPTSMEMPITMNDAIPLGEQLGYYPNNGIMEMQNQGTLNYPEVNWKGITPFEGARTLIPNPDYIDYETGENLNIDDTSKIPSWFTRGKEALGTGKDAIQNAINLGLGSITGLPFVGSALDFIGNQFEYRPAEIYGDEYGRIYNPEALDRANARGGWYTEPARASRRRDARIDWMEKRKAAGKRFSENNLARLQEQQRQEEAARVAATRAMAAQNAQTYGTDDATGGYQSSWGGNENFMSGSGTAADMGSFAHGGLASLWQR